MADGRALSRFAGVRRLSEALPSRLILADHLLKDGVGHHLGYNIALADAAVRRGMGVEIVSSREFDPGLAPGVSARRLFRRDYRAEPPMWVARNHRLLTLLERWCDWRFRADLGRLRGVGPEDAIFAQMIAPRHFRRWVEWLAASGSRAVLFLHLGYRPERFGTLRTEIERLEEDVRRRLVFITDSEKLVEPFGRALGYRVHYLPHVISYPLASNVAKAAGVTIYQAGNARREKGFAEVVEAVRRILESGNPGGLRFVLQCNHPDSVAVEILRDRPCSGPFLEWIDRAQSNAEYIRRLASADVVLLPYHSDLYVARTSGIFCECRVLGKPVVASRGTWAGDRVARDGGGWLVGERNVGELTAILQRIPEEREAVTAAARALAPAARAEFHRDALMERLVKLWREARGV